MFSGWIGAIVAGGAIATLSVIGFGIYKVLGDYYDLGKDSAKLDQTKKELADAERAAEILAEQRTRDDTAKRLGDGTL